jgi:U3 small nucleolar RNA-associated protein 6
MEDSEGDKAAKLAESLRQQGKRDDSELLAQTGTKYWPANEALQKLSVARET